MAPLDVVSVAVLAFVGFRLVTVAGAAVRRPVVRARVRAIVVGLRPRHFVPVPLVLAAVGGTAFALVQLPLLDLGWWTAIGGYGNPVTGGTDSTTGTVFEWLVPLVFALLLLPGIPLFAEAEERMFRLGAEGWGLGRRAWKGVQFGLVHLVVGIPIGVALALSIGGWWFTGVYLRGYRLGGRAEALLESTRAHTAYNATIVVLLLASLLTYV